MLGCNWNINTEIMNSGELPRYETGQDDCYM